MKKFIATGIALIAFSGSAVAQWYSDGDLHSATVSEWRAASGANKLATAADWALQSPTISEEVQASGTLNTLRPYARELVSCIDQSITGTQTNSRTSELAAACMILLDWI